MSIFYKENTTKYKLSMRVLSIVLAVLMVFSGGIIECFAADFDAVEPETEIAQEENVEEETADEETPAEFLAEDEAKREEDVKHFQMSDGTVQAAQYPIPVHFEKDGKWTDYDNTLEEVDADEEENDGKLLKNRDLTNKTADYNVRLSKKTNGHKFVRIEKDGYKISWYYENAEKSTAKYAENKEDNDPTTLEKLTSVVHYDDVFKNTDFEYILNSKGVKENILLQKSNAPTEFKAVYKATGLTPVQIDDKTIELRSENDEAVYVISAPCMIDENGEVSNNLKITLTDIKNDTFTVELTLDKEWLNADEREYPITVDPMLETNQSPDGVQSAFSASGSPNKNYLTSSTNDMGSLYVGNIYGYGQTESYIKFTKLPKLDVADKVVQANLFMYLRECQLGLQVDAHRLKYDWNPNTVTWNNRPYSYNEVEDYMPLKEANDNEWRSVELTDMVRGWYSGEYPNYGLVLYTQKTASAKAWFYSIHYADYTEARPVMMIQYRNMSGYEGHWSYTNVSSGRGGVASVNNFNGNLVFSQPITQDAGGELMPVDLSVVYNSNKGNPKYSNIGNHAQTNYHTYIMPESGQLWDKGYKYYINDADGTKHWFKFEEGSNTIGKDEDGLGLTLSVITVGSDKDEPLAKYIVTDVDENKMYFDKAGCLVRIKNPSNVSSTVEYETVSGVRRIKCIRDGAGRAYNFYYVSSNPDWILDIKDPAGRNTHFGYTSYNLIDITFADGKVIKMSYGSNAMLQEIKGIDGTRTKIAYDNSSQRRISSINWGTSDSELLEKYSFSYKQNETTITDIQSRSYTYQFNNYGQNTGIISNIDGSAQFFEYNHGDDPGIEKANKLISESRVFKSTTNYVVNPGFTRGFAGFWTYMNDSTGASVAVDNSKGSITSSSVKVTKPSSNLGRVNAVQTINNLPGGTYTLSAYINTNGATIPGNGVQMFAEIHQPGNGAYISSENIEKTTKTNGWERRSVTFTVPDGGTVRATMGFGPDASGTVWLDDWQLERSEGPSSYNMVENSAFTNGLTNWTARTDGAGTVTWAGLEGFDNCAKLTGSTEPADKRFIQYIPASGKKGDVFSYGMWAWANSVPLNSTKDKDGYKPAFELSVDYYDASGKWAGSKHKSYNPDVKGAWQFLTDKIVMPTDYSKIAISLLYNHNANIAYQTGSFVYKEQYGQTYDYDWNGNLMSVTELDKSNSTFSYHGGYMKQMLNPSGSRYLYTYNNQKQMTYALSDNGQEYGFKYDDKGNVTSTEVTSRKPATTVENGKAYIFVNAYSGLDINSGPNGNSGDELKTWHYDSHTATHQWVPKLVAGTTDVYEIYSVRFPEQCFDITSNSNANGTELQIYKNAKVTAQRFKFVKQSDGTFGIFTASSNYTKCLDAQLDSQSIIMSRIVKQADCDKNNLKGCQKWYLIPVEKTEDKTIVTETEYTDSKNFASSSTDQRGNKTTYSYDETRGTLNSVTDAAGNITEYTYNPNNNDLTSVTSGGMTNSYSYANDRLTNISVNDKTRYGFAYDKFGRQFATLVGSNGKIYSTLSLLEYNNAGLMSKQTYGNSDYIDFAYDNLDRVTEKRYNGNNNKRVTYAYGNDGKVARTTDYFTNTNTRFTYDLAGRVVSQREFTGTSPSRGDLKSYTNFKYEDKTNRLSFVQFSFPAGYQSFGYRYGDQSKGEMADAVYGLTWNGEELIQNSYDGFGRLSSKKINNLDNKFTYEDVGTDKTTTLVRSVETANGKYTYAYDELGNIVYIHDGKYGITYEYDELNQLVRENDQRAGKSYTYSYTNGNITERKEYAFALGNLGEVLDTKTWTYGDSSWADLLTEFNGEQITYDFIGNPKTIGTKQLTWLGRQLQSITDGENTITYEYNGDGQRISKTVNGVKTEYFYNGSMLAAQRTGDDLVAFMTDENGELFGFSTTEGQYFYIKNAQNDVTAIADKDGNIVANYYYDAWGKLIDVTGDVELAKLNPIRYRSYYFDEETSWYFLNTRYYNPESCRFISADGIYDTNSGMLEHNMFTYCTNAPINKHDPTGQCWHRLGFFDCKKCKNKKELAKLQIEPFGKYNNKNNVYIVSQNEAEKLEPLIPKKDVIIVDKRKNDDPNMQVKSSYKISKKKQQKKIIQLMQNYNELHPVLPAWSRTDESLLTEWKFHNIAYDLRIKRERTADTDFNNGDEGKDFWDFVEKARG